MFVCLARECAYAWLFKFKFPREKERFDRQSICLWSCTILPSLHQRFDREDYVSLSRRQDTHVDRSPLTRTLRAFLFLGPQASDIGPFTNSARLGGHRLGSKTLHIRTNHGKRYGVIAYVVHPLVIHPAHFKPAPLNPSNQISRPFQSFDPLLASHLNPGEPGSLDHLSSPETSNLENPQHHHLTVLVPTSLSTLCASPHNTFL